MSASLFWPLAPVHLWLRRRGGENSLLNVSDALAVSLFIFVLVFLVGSFDGSGAVAGCIRVENPYIKICVLSSKPEPSGTDV